MQLKPFNKYNKSNKLNQVNQIFRLTLGTAQLGMDYGIANRTGQPDYDTARSIVQEAWESGICEFDTARAYGQSEKILGRIINDLGIAGKARVITKFAPNPDHSDKAALDEILKISMDNLGVESLYGMMLHREDMLELWEKELGRYLRDLVSIGRVNHIGVSVYSPEKAIVALNTNGIEIVQLPTNVIDRRFENAGIFDLAKDVGKTIYIRSIFLQGLLLMSPESLPKHMRYATPVLNKLALFANDIGLTVKELCIGYIKHTFPHSKLVFGVETPAQVREIIERWDVAWPRKLSKKIQTEFNDVNEMILNASMWPKGNDKFLL